MNDKAFALNQVQTLESKARRDVSGTLELLSDAGIRVIGSPTDTHVYEASRAPWQMGSQINAGQAMAFHTLMSDTHTFSLDDLLQLASDASGPPPDLIPAASIAKGWVEELTASQRNPVWASLVEGTGDKDILPALQEIASGATMNESTDRPLSSEQIFLLSVRMRNEYTGALSELAPLVGIPGPTTAKKLPALQMANAKVDSEASPCKLDSPLLDSVINDGLKESFKWTVGASLGKSPQPIWSDEPELTWKAFGNMLSAANFWSTLANLVLIKALARIDLSTDPSSFDRTKTRTPGMTGSVSLHAHMAEGPSGKYQHCVEKVLAAAGLSFKPQPAREIANSKVTWTVEGVDPIISSQYGDSSWHTTTSDAGLTKTYVVGLPQSHDLQEPLYPVQKHPVVRAAINPDTAETFWQTNYRAVMDAWGFGNGIGIGPSKKVNPLSIGTSVAKFAARALNHAGWLNDTIKLSVTDWTNPAQADQWSGSINYTLSRNSHTVSGTGETGDDSEGITATFSASGSVDPLSYETKLPATNTINMFDNSSVQASPNYIGGCGISSVSHKSGSARDATPIPMSLRPALSGGYAYNLVLPRIQTAENFNETYSLGPPDPGAVCGDTPPPFQSTLQEYIPDGLVLVCPLYNPNCIAGIVAPSDASTSGVVSWKPDPDTTVTITWNFSIIPVR